MMLRCAVAAIALSLAAPQVVAQGLSGSLDGPNQRNDDGVGTFGGTAGTARNTLGDIEGAMRGGGGTTLGGGGAGSGTATPPAGSVQQQAIQAAGRYNCESAQRIPHQAGASCESYRNMIIIEACKARIPKAEFDHYWSEYGRVAEAMANEGTNFSRGCGI